MKQLRVIIVDDNPIFLKSFSNFLSSIHYINLVGTATSGEKALREVTRKKPDLVFIDFSMDGINGVKTAQKIKQINNDVKTIIISFGDNYDFSSYEENFEFDAFINKSELSEKLFPSIKRLFPHFKIQSNKHNTILY